MVNSYSYMNEDAIDDELKCAICSLPFQEPVSSNQCHHTFCQECINTWLNQERRCPICRTNSDYEHYQPIRSRALLNQLNRLPVRCDACQVRNIQRVDFQGHTQRCPSWVIPCTAADIRCTWQGMRNQLANHIKNCLFQRIRPVVNDLHGQINNLQGQIQTHTQQIKDLQGQTQTQIKEINQLQDIISIFKLVLGIFICAAIIFLMRSIQGQSRQPRSLGEKFRRFFENQ